LAYLNIELTAIPALLWIVIAINIVIAIAARMNLRPAKTWLLEKGFICAHIKAIKNDPDPANRWVMLICSVLGLGWIILAVLVFGVKTFLHIFGFGALLTAIAIFVVRGKGIC
jgi:hypothetical protein